MQSRSVEIPPQPSSFNPLIITSVFIRSSDCNFLNDADKIKSKNYWNENIAININRIKKNRTHQLERLLKSYKYSEMNKKKDWNDHRKLAHICKN